MAVAKENKVVHGNDLIVIGQEIKEALANKQNTISDLSTIRSGAAAGATAYQKPSNGIPASDLANGVIPTVPSIDPTPTANSTNLVTSGGVKSYVDNNSAPEAVKYVAQSLTDAQKQQARTNIGAGDFSGNPIVNLGTPSTPDGTIVATLANGDTVTIDLNHNHPQYLKYVMLESEGDMPANPDSTTLYMWPETE